MNPVFCGEGEDVIGGEEGFVFEVLEGFDGKNSGKEIISKKVKR
jgi:hypothetical protein